MANNENGKGLLGILQGAVDSVKSTVEGIKLPEIHISNPFQGNPVKKEEPTPPEEIKSISSKSAIKIIFYMMAADGKIYHDEEEKFNEIGRELDPDFEANKDTIFQECQAQMSKVTDLGDYYSVLQDGVAIAITAGANAKESIISPKVLAWDLLAVAYSDGNYDDKERQLMKYIVHKFNIDKTVFLEMESSFLTLMDLENELNWIKTTDRPYLTIESIVNEISDRKTAILEGLKDLIAL